MDNQTQSFLELSAKNDLVQLVADKRAAWLWSADGARVLWANAAGGSFFSAQSVSDLAGLTSLERSPARPHIARIATSGLVDKFTIDRLRFYRGLRVMLLTCQCKRIELENGEAAALIVCSDKGLALTKDPVSAFAQFVKTEKTTVFLMSSGSVDERLGTLAGIPEDLDLPESQRALFGPLDLNGAFHEGIILQVPAGPKLVMLDDAPLNDDLPVEETHSEEAAPDELTEEQVPATDQSAAPVAASALLGLERTEQQPELADINPFEGRASGLEVDGELGTGGTAVSDETAIDPVAPAPSEEVSEPSETDADTHQVELADQFDDQLLGENPGQDQISSAEAGNIDHVADPSDATGQVPAETVETEATAEELSFEDTKAETADQVLLQEPVADLEEPDTDLPENPERTEGAEETSEFTGNPETFVFQPRRRPVRFAWKMDIDQRFTFLSDEFSEVLGPNATDIVGQTWQEVSKNFDIDPRGNIARALDRRDTWSGKTVDWPVSGAPLRVPVDMAALPAFDRNRKFEGYRGFGVCRTADAVQDPDNPVVSPVVAFAPDAGSEISESDITPTDNLIDLDEEAAEANSPEAIDDAKAELSDPATSVPQDETAQDDVSASEGADVEDANVDDAPIETVTHAELAAETSEALAETRTQSQKLEDLKPAQPDSFAGKTFLGASAAALVGSLAKFTGKSGSKTSSTPDHPAEDVDLIDDLQSAAAALDDNPSDGSPGTEPHEQVEPEEGFPDDAANENPEEDSGSADLRADDPTQEQEEDAPSIEPAVDNDAEEALGEPAGISGPAELKPAEIEDAVKTLQKSYNASEKLKSLDLFDEENQSVQSDTGKQETAADTTESEEAEINPDDIPSEDEIISEMAPEEAAPEDAPDEQDDDAGDRQDADTASTETELEAEDSERDEEREFFEETGAFEHEEQAVETDDDTAEDTEPVKTGEVIPLVTARPRVVPVDTSSLSRPERQAFRKIAEALGARLEGDLEDFDSPDPEEETIEDLPPEVPEAGPIDPSLLDRLPIGIAVVHDREVLYANKALISMLGYKSIAALSQAGGLEALFIDDTEELPDAVGMDDEVDETMKMRLADGGVLCVDAHMHSVPWNDSRGLMISITERPAKQTSPTPAAPSSPNFFAEVRSELETARSQIAEMDTILETATDGVLVLDQHGTIVKVNGSAEALFSANRVDMIGAPFQEFLAPESHRAAADYLDGLSRNGVASILNDGREVLGKVPTGGLIPLFMTIGRITSTKDDAKFCAVLRDITQWKTAEEELTQAKRQAENASSQKSDFLAKISHEIRTPLNAIIGFSEVMMEERFGPIGNDRYKDYLKDIRTSGSHIMSLINDLLDLSKIEAGKLDLNFSAVSTNDVINECVALMQPQANRERVIIRASLPESVPDVVADPRSLRQIVLNLLSNAIKYNKSGGQVILSTALESNGEVALRVRDTGTGMTAKQLAAALEPFRQLHTTSRGGGTGLGLPLTKALVEANRASFHIDSTPDQGTLVEILFPTQRVLSE